MPYVVSFRKLVNKIQVGTRESRFMNMRHKYIIVAAFKKP